jgi:hypothetical protein
MAGIVAVGFVALVAIAGVMEQSRPAGLPEDDPIVMAIGVGFLALACLDFGALGLGVGGLFQANRSRALPIVGITISALTLFAAAILLAIGLAME